MSVMTSDRKERRRLPRIASNTEAIMVSGDGTTRQTAAIRNVSADGALVELPEPQPVTGETYLLLPGHRLQPIRPVWRRGRAVGVSYPDDEH